VASADNDLRLGANEAPPAIISVFLGDLLTKIIERIASGEPIKDPESYVLEMGVSRLPQLAKDYTDRNRTSPFAFTGNKFEFRAVGSSANTAQPLMVLIAAMADSLGQMTTRLDAKLKGGVARDQAVIALLREVFAETAPIRFEGNNYSAEWKAEAKKRGLPNLPDTPASIAAISDPERTAFLTDLKIFTQRELDSRVNVSLERYIKTVTLEAETVIEMLATQVLPAGEKQLAESAEAAAAVKAAGVAPVGVTSRVGQMAKAVEEVAASLHKLDCLLESGEKLHDERKEAVHLAAEVRPALITAREAADRLEHLVDDEMWPCPKYREMLFVK
jgi:glutamine synthetase